jgi:4-hydroxy-2-oxoheptanedioate aldolase
MLEDMMEALTDIAARARKAGKRAGIYLTDLSGAGRLTAMGYQLLAIGPEAKLMSVGAQALIGQARATISS